MFCTKRFLNASMSPEQSVETVRDVESTGRPAGIIDGTRRSYYYFSQRFVVVCSAAAAAIVCRPCENGRGCAVPHKSRLFSAADALLKRIVACLTTDSSYSADFG